MGSHLNNWTKFWLVSFGIVILLPLNFPAFAKTKLLNISLKTAKNQSFANLMQQAELTANTLISQEFAQASPVTEVGVTINGERNGQEVPLLSARVSRTNWQAQPKIQSWTNYFTKAEILLGFNQLPKTQPNVPKSSINSIQSNIESDPGFRDD